MKRFLGIFGRKEEQRADADRPQSGPVEEAAQSAEPVYEPAEPEEPALPPAEPESLNEYFDERPSPSGDGVAVPAAAVLPELPPECLSAPADQLVAAHADSPEFSFWLERADLMYGLSVGKITLRVGDLARCTDVKVFAPELAGLAEAQVDLPLSVIVPLVPTEWLVAPEQDRSRERVIAEMDDLFTTEDEEQAGVDMLAGSDAEPQLDTEAPTMAGAPVQEPPAPEAPAAPPAPEPIAPAETVAPVPTVDGDTINVPGMTVLEHLPAHYLRDSLDALRAALARRGDFVFPFQRQELLTALRQGTVRLTWGQLVSRTDYQVFGSAVRAVAEEMVELPLSVVVPLVPTDWFKLGPQKTVKEEILQEMADVFTPDAGSEAEAEAVAPAPAALAEASPRPPAAAAPPGPPPVAAPKPEPAAAASVAKAAAAKEQAVPEPAATPVPAATEAPEPPEAPPQPPVGPEAPAQPEAPAAEEVAALEAVPSEPGVPAAGAPPVEPALPSEVEEAVTDELETPELLEPAAVAAAGEKYFGPGVAASPAPAARPGDETPVAAWRSQAPNGINVNEAPVDQLCLLTGVGEVLAGEIVASRQAEGPFRELPDLLRVVGLGRHTYRSITGLGPGTDLSVAERRLNTNLSIESDHVSLSAVAEAAVREGGLAGVYISTVDGLQLAHHVTEPVMGVFAEGISAAAAQLQRRGARTLKQALLPPAAMATFVIGRRAVTFAGNGPVFVTFIHARRQVPVRQLTFCSRLADELCWYCSYRAVT